MQAVCIAQAVNGKVRCAAWTLPFCKITPNCSINPFTPAVFSFLLQNKGRLTIPCFCVLVCAWLKVFTVSMAAQNQTFQVNSAELKNSLCFPDWTPCRLPITSSWFPFAHYMLPRIGTCILLMEKKKKKSKKLLTLHLRLSELQPRSGGSRAGDGGSCMGALVWHIQVLPVSGTEHPHPAHSLTWWV